MAEHKVSCCLFPDQSASKDVFYTLVSVLARFDAFFMTKQSSNNSSTDLTIKCKCKLPS